MPLLFLSGGLGWTEVVVILVVVFLLFGAKKFPEMMRSLGKGINEFKRSMDSGESGDPGKGEGTDEGKKDPPREDQV